MDKAIAEPLAFLVLSAWPLATLIFLLLGIFIIWRVVRAKASGKKLATGFITAIIIILIPTWDVIAGRIQYSYLCATKGGIRIYKHVKLDTNLQPLELPESPLAYERMAISKRYPYGYDSSEDILGPGKIYYFRDMIRDGKTSELLGTLTKYAWRGGWFENTFSLQGAGGGICGREEVGFQALVNQIFEVPR